jgi:Protein of unknown function (DUF2470)
MSALGPHTDGAGVYRPTPEVVEFIATYMNENQADALVDIARAHGLSADRARVKDLTETAMVLSLAAADREQDAEVPWPRPLQRREDVRMFLLEMQEDARL